MQNPKLHWPPFYSLDSSNARRPSPIKKLQRIICLIILFFNIVVVFGQVAEKKQKSVFLELAGSGGLGSINFEKQFHNYKNTKFTWRVGLSLAPIDKNNGTGIVFPLMLNALIGKNAHKLELGIGQGITFTTKGSFFALTAANVGYRYQAEQKRWFYRVTYTPLISYLIDYQIQHWAGISIGYTFSNFKK